MRVPDYYIFGWDVAFEDGHIEEDARQRVPDENEDPRHDISIW